VTEKLPIAAKDHDVVALASSSRNLIGRGLTSIQSRVYTLSIADRDALYRKARDTFNRITEDDNIWSARAYSSPEMLAKLKAVFKTFQQLADLQYGKAYFPLSDIYLIGCVAKKKMASQGIPDDEGRSDYYNRLAFDWCLANKERNDPEIWNDLGVLYQIIKEDDDQAFFCFLQSAKLGDGAGMFRLSKALESGKGVDRDEEKSLYWLEKSAQRNHVAAQFKIGNMSLGRSGEQEFDLEMAFNWSLLAANAGHVGAQLDVGLMYEAGRGIPQDDANAVFWLKEAAESGNPTAQWLLAGMYEYGRGVIPDFDVATDWYEKAADQGDQRAIKDLERIDDQGYLYDDDMATSWNRESAKNGHTWAMFNLGVMYLEGKLVDPDRDQAIDWFRQAADRGHIDAQEHLKQLGIDWKTK